MSTEEREWNVTVTDRELGVRRVLAENGELRVDFEPEPGLIHVLTLALQRFLADAPNYRTAEFVVGEADSERYYMTVGRVEGKTPHAKREEAEALLRDLRTFLSPYGGKAAELRSSIDALLGEPKR